jgi:hypothetical protein
MKQYDDQRPKPLITEFTRTAIHKLCFMESRSMSYPSLCFNWAPRKGGVLVKWRYISTHSLTSALDGGEWSASRSGLFTPRERATLTHWIGGWVGLRAVPDAVVKRKILSPRQESPRTPIIQPAAQRYTDWAITALLWYMKYDSLKSVSSGPKWSRLFLRFYIQNFVRVSCLLHSYYSPPPPSPFFFRILIPIA